MISKIAIGTAQFGMNYGISNKLGIVKQSEVSKILNKARFLGINTIDMAQSYGISEKILGNFDLTGFDIITKISEPGRSAEKEAIETLSRSLTLLRKSEVYGVCCTVLKNYYQKMETCYSEILSK